MRIILALSWFIVAIAAQQSCGMQKIPPIFPHIVGGSEAVPGSWPWQANLFEFKDAYFYPYTFCGGTLINNQWVLTAAHCWYGLESLDLSEHNRFGEGDKAYSQTFTVSKVIIHPEYNSNTYYADIALLMLDRRVTFTDHIQPACLPDVRVEDLCDDFVATGWGRNKEGGNTFAEHLQQVQVPFVDTATCNEPQSYNGQVLGTMLCAGFSEGGKDACQGDSGGPLVCKEIDGLFYVHGITSWGYGCARPSYPGVYTRVAFFTKWIIKVISP